MLQIKTLIRILPIIFSIAILSSCKEDKVKSVSNNQSLKIGDKIVDASCFSLLLSDEQQLPSEGKGITLNNCHRDDVQPFDSNNYDPSDYQYTYVNNDNNTDVDEQSTTPDGSMHYKVLGNINDEYIIKYQEISGEVDTGIGFESLLRVKINNQGVKLKDVYASGGDKCAGGVKSAAVENQSVIYQINLTPASIYNLSIPNHPFDAPNNNDATDVVNGICPAYIEKHDNEISKIVLVKNSPVAQNAFNDKKSSACFYEIFNEFAQQFPNGLNVQQFSDFRNRLVKKCHQN